MYQALTEDLLDILSKHKEWLSLMNREPFAELTAEEMKLRADLSGLVLHAYDFSYVDLRYANAYATDFTNCKFTNANLKGIEAGSAIFDECLMICSILRNCHAREASFVGTNLTKSDISHSFIEKADFEEADLTDVKFHGAFMEGCKIDFIKTYFRGADFSYFHPGKSDVLAIQLMRKANSSFI